MRFLGTWGIWKIHKTCLDICRFCLVLFSFFGLQELTFNWTSPFYSLKPSPNPGRTLVKKHVDGRNPAKQLRYIIIIIYWYKIDLRWWFQTFCIFIPTWGNDPSWNHQPVIHDWPFLKISPISFRYHETCVVGSRSWVMLNGTFRSFWSFSPTVLRRVYHMRWWKIALGVWLFGKKGGVSAFFSQKKGRNDFGWQNLVKSLDQTNYLVNYLQRCPSYDDNGLMVMVSFVITGVSTVCSTKALHLLTI